MPKPAEEYERSLEEATQEQLELTKDAEERREEEDERARGVPAPRRLREAGIVILTVSRA